MQGLIEQAGVEPTGTVYKEYNPMKNEFAKFIFWLIVYSVFGFTACYLYR